MNEKPFPKYNKKYEFQQHPYNGTWNYVKRENKHLKFHSWPKPWNFIQKIDVLHCDQLVMLKAQFYGPIAAEMWFDTFVPSPTELFRNWVFGSMRCGKKMKIKGGLPGFANLFFNPSTRIVLAEFGGILGRPLLWWSMGQTAFNALSTWTTIINRQIICDELEAHGIMRDGQGRIQFEGEGAIPFFEEVYDRNGWGTPLTGTWEPPTGHRMGWAIGTSINLHPSISAAFSVGIQCFSSGGIQWSSMTLAPGEEKKWGVSGHGVGPSPLQVWVKLDNDLPGVLSGVETFVHRFMVTSTDQDPVNKSMLDPWHDEPGPYDVCERLYGDAS